MKKVHLFILLFVSFIFQGCFELIEQIQLKNDGSGSYQLVLNMSQSKTKLNSVMKMQTINGHPVPSKYDILSKLKNIENTMSKSAGISHAKTSMDFDNYICTVSCDFTNVAQLNKLIKKIELQENAANISSGDDFVYDATTKMFQRKNSFSLNKMYKKMSNADKEIFSNATYTSIAKFESEVTTVSNKDAKISSNKKAVMLKQDALNIVTGKKTIENKINISK